MARCLHLTDAADMIRCGRPESHPRHDPLGDDPHPFDAFPPPLAEDGEPVFEPDDGEAW